VLRLTQLGGRESGGLHPPDHLRPAREVDLVPSALERMGDAKARVEIPAAVPTCPENVRHDSSFLVVVGDNASDEAFDHQLGVRAVETDVTPQQSPHVDIAVR
jgi:hypothetical protein